MNGNLLGGLGPGSLGIQNWSIHPSRRKESNPGFIRVVGTLMKFQRIGYPQNRYKVHI